MMKRKILFITFILALSALTASSLNRGTTYLPTDRTWEDFVKYCSTVNGKADSTAQDLLRKGKETVFRDYLRALTFYSDGKMLVTNSSYTDVYITPVWISEGRVLIPRSCSNAIFSTSYSENGEYELINFGFLSPDESSISLNPNILRYSNYFTLYRR